MKKSLIALAVLAASGAVMAQSTVTLYGKADVGLRKVTGATTQMQENHSNRWGLLGTEDLGGGLKATFRLENRFNLDTGANNSGLPANIAPATLMFRAQANVGLAGGFGSVKLGRIYNPVEEINGNMDPFTNDGVAASQLNALFLTRQDNAIRYDSPKMSGFAVQAIWSAAEGGANLLTPVPAGDPLGVVNDGVGISATYNAGPLYVGVGYNKKANTYDSNFTAIGASYAFGDAKLGLYYDTATIKNGTAVEASDDITGIFGTYKLGSGLVKMGLTWREKNTGVAGAASTTDKRYGFGYQYNLSKRTSLYADYARNDFDAPATTDTNGYQFGITHNF